LDRLICVNVPTAYIIVPHGTNCRMFSTEPSVPLVAICGVHGTGVTDTGPVDAAKAGPAVINPATASAADSATTKRFIIPPFQTAPIEPSLGSTAWRPVKDVPTMHGRSCKASVS
jgi:hypothetical protein